MLSLRELLENHRAHSNETPLATVVGDGFLYARNPVYRNLRDASVHFGIEYTSEDYCSYQVLPLAALPEMIRQNRIPFQNNLAPLERIAGTAAGKFRFPEFPGSRPANYLLHESAHCVAAILLGNNLDFSGPGAQDAALRTMMGESFANTLEAASNAYVDTEAHADLLRLNSYLPYGMGSRRKSVCDLLETLGLENGFRYLFVSFLFSNFLYGELKRKGVTLVHSLIAPEAKLTPARLGVLKRASALAFELNRDFRTNTARFYFQFVGAELPLEDLLNFNFLAKLFRDPELRAGLDQMARLFEHGVQPATTPLTGLKAAA